MRIVVPSSRDAAATLPPVMKLSNPPLAARGRSKAMAVAGNLFQQVPAPKRLENCDATLEAGDSGTDASSQ